MDYRCVITLKTLIKSLNSVKSTKIIPKTSKFKNQPLEIQPNSASPMMTMNVISKKILRKLTDRATVTSQ